MKRTLSMVLILLLSIALAAAALAEASPQNEAPPPEIETIIEEYQTVFSLTIRYVCPDGSTAAQTYPAHLNAGTSYSVDSPGSPGYSATRSVVDGTMPARDMQYTVVYIPGNTHDPDNPIFLLTIEDYETALGFGASFMHVGVCVE